MAPPPPPSRCDRMHRRTLAPPLPPTPRMQRQPLGWPAARRSWGRYGQHWQPGSSSSSSSNRQLSAQRALSGAATHLLSPCLPRWALGRRSFLCIGQPHLCLWLPRALACSASPTLQRLQPSRMLEQDRWRIRCFAHGQALVAHMRYLYGAQVSTAGLPNTEGLAMGRAASARPVRTP